jgi:phenylacetate-CoA ligase
MTLEKIEKASQDELQALQLKRLQWSLAHAYNNVAHYKKTFDAAGVHPSDLKQLADLAKFPTMSKTDLRDNYPFGLFAVPKSDIVRIHASSGTTGKPTVVAYTQKDIDTWADLVARSIRAAGGKRGDTVHVAYGYGLFTGGLGAHYGAERLGCTVVPMGGGQTEKQLQLITDFKPDIIMVTPSYMLTLIEAMEKQGIDPKQSSLRIGIFGAEPWTNEMRREIEVRANMKAVDIYGLSEVMGPGVASECVETQDGLVVWEDHFYPEIIDPVTGVVLPYDPAKGTEQGELVFTSLTKEALPIIRYRTRDLTRLLPPTARSMRRMGKITGRSDDMLIIRGVNVFPTQIEELILKMPALSPQYLIHVSRTGHLDEMKIQVERRESSVVVADATSDAAIARELQSAIKTFIGSSAQIEVLAPNSLARVEVGKAKRVIDSR